MVLIGGVKYACERCIRGHRVTTCNHTDQPLMMIKPKGRPSSQCKHCKELRKNKNSHGSGACTCGKNRRPSTTNSSGAIHKCSCKTGEPCQCHGRRKRTDSRSNLSQTKSPSEESSSLSLANGSSPFISRPPSSSLNWKNNSHSSTSQAPQSQTKTTPTQQDVRVRQIGMDPLTNAKPVSDSTRTRVGEVSVPINEYVPNNSNGIGNVNDKMPDVFFQDVPLPFEPGHGLLDLFANNNNTTSVNPYFYEDPRHDLPTKHNQQHYNNVIRSPSDASGSNHNQINSPDKHNQHSINSNFQRTDSAMSLSSMDSNSNSNSQMSRVNASSDSLASGNNFHHYDNMIHKQNHNLNQQQHGQNGNQNDDAASIQSVEVLSLTPSFLDIPTDFKNEKGYFSNTHDGQSQSQSQQNDSNFQKHRFTASIDSIQSGQSGQSGFRSNHNFDQSSYSKMNSNLINNSENPDFINGIDLNIPRELTKTNSDESSFTENSLFNSFNTKLTTSGL